MLKTQRRRKSTVESTLIKEAKKFDYREYLAHNWLLQEARTLCSSSVVCNSEQDLYNFVARNCHTMKDLQKFSQAPEMSEAIQNAGNMSPVEFIQEYVAEWGDWVDPAKMLGLKAIHGPEHKTGSLYLHKGLQEGTPSDARKQAILQKALKYVEENNYGDSEPSLDDLEWYYEESLNPDWRDSASIEDVAEAVGDCWLDDDPGDDYDDDM